MKKQDKIDIIQQGIADKLICRCFFTYEPDYYYYYYFNAVNEKFILGQAESDFQLDGYCIHKISHLKKVELKDDKCNEINKMFGITEQICMPNVDISSWHTIFESLKNLNAYIIIEDEINNEYSIGIIEKVCKNRVYFKRFDADGVWDEEGMVIPFSQITTVKWGTRYAEYWRRYLERV